MASSISQRMAAMEARLDVLEDALVDLEELAGVTDEGIEEEPAEEPAAKKGK